MTNGQDEPGALEFYFAPGASSMAVHIALHEVGVPFLAHPLSLARRETRSPEFLKLNPAGQVPLLRIGDQSLTEVAAILYYLARRFPKARLWPEGELLLEASVMSWLSFIAASLHRAHAHGEEHAQRMFEIADTRLGRVGADSIGAGPWAVGAYSVADIHLFRLFWRFRHSFDLPPGSYPHLMSHYDRMMKRSAVAETCRIEAAIGYELVGFRAP